MPGNPNVLFRLQSARSRAHLWFGVWILIVLSAYRLTTELADPFRRFLEQQFYIPLADLIVNVLFFWLLILLWLAYRQWSAAVFRERELEAVIGSISPDVLLVVSPDRTMQMCNATVEAMFGYKPDEVVGRKTDLLYFDRRLTGRKHELFTYLERVGFHLGTATGRRRDGRTFPVEIITGAIRDQGGAVVLIRDITERMEAEHALRGSERRFRLFMQHLPACVFIRDKAGRFVYVNQHFASTLGVDELSVVGRADSEILPPEMTSSLREDDKNLEVGAGILRRVEEVTIRGSKRFFDTYRFALPDEKDEFLLAGICMDVTEQRQAEEDRTRMQEQMLQTQKLESLGLLGGGIAHDFNNLLAGILGYADLAMAEMPASSPAYASIREVVSSSKRAAELCGQLLAYSGQGNLTLEVLSLSRLVDDMRQLLEISVTKKASLVLDLAEPLVSTECDATQMRQVLMNLVVNASEALDEKPGIVRVVTSEAYCTRETLGLTVLGEDLPEGRYVSMSVRDTGCGMAEETKARMFDPFFSTKFAGRGLGMAAVLGIVRGHGGAIKVDTELGKGTTVTVFLPVSAKPLAEKANHDAVSREEWKGEGTALVVDDEPVVRSLAVNMFKKMGFATKSAVNGAEALKMLKDDRDVSVVLLDMTMPVYGGAETYESIRSSGSKVPIIFSSGYNKAEEVDALKDPLAAFIRKPYSYSSFRAAVQEMLASCEG